MLSGLFDRRLGRFRLDHPVRVDRPMILISQIQRSGGTLLAALLDGHPALFNHPYELSWGRPKKWNWPDLDLGQGRPSQIFGRLDQAWVRKHARRAYYTKGPAEDTQRYPFIFDCGLQRELFSRRLAREPARRQRDILDAYLTSFFNAWYDCQGLYLDRKLFVTAFTPRVVMIEDSLARFARDYPDGYVVSSIRHPAGWFASAVKHKYEKKHGSVPAVMDFWLRSTRAAIAAKQRLGSRLIAVTFEDLVRDPEKAMRRVCARTELPWHPSLSVPTFNGMPAESNSHFDSRIRHVDPEAGDRFRKVLPAETIAAIDRIAREVHEEALAMIRADMESDAGSAGPASLGAAVHA